LQLLPKYAVENDLDTTLTIDFDAVVPLQKIRIANTQFNGAGTASFTYAGLHIMRVF